MDVVDWLLSVRKKPLAERKRFVGLFTIVLTATVASLWFLLTVTVGPLKFGVEVEKNNLASPWQLTLPEMPPFPKLPSLTPGR